MKNAKVFDLRKADFLSIETFYIRAHIIIVIVEYTTKNNVPNLGNVITYLL